MQSHYEINVAANGQHLFATAQRSATNIKDAEALYKVLSAKFPASEGYTVTATYWKAEGHTVKF